jgi:hypothetical protein
MAFDQNLGKREKRVDPHRYNDNGACEDNQSHHFF